MKKKMYGVTVGRICAIMSVALFYCTPALSAPYLESRYYSLYQQPKTYTYTDVSGAQKTQTRVGFRYQNDLTDSIVVCGKENDSTCIDGIVNLSRSLYANYQGEITTFKVYVPPGTTSVNLNSGVGQDTGLKYFAVARLGSPPQVDSTYAPSAAEFDTLPYSGFTLNQLRAGDCIGRNSGGYLMIAKDSGATVATESQGGWLYVIVKVIYGNILDNVYTNRVNVGNKSTAGTYMWWHANKTATGTWGTLNEQSYIDVPTPTPTPVPTPTPTGTPVPTPTPTGTPVPTPTPACDMYTCPNGNCVNGICVPVTPTPTPTSGCNILPCVLSGGTCVNNVCVKAGPTPTPVPTPTPTPAPVSLIFEAKPLSQMSVERKSCANVDFGNLIPVLTSSSPPIGTVTFYSALFFGDVDLTMFFAQKDILQKEAFIYYVNGESIKGHSTGEFPADGSWEDTAFKTLFSALSGINCALLADTGISFLFGYAPGGDLTQFQGAVFTFATTP